MHSEGVARTRGRTPSADSTSVIICLSGVLSHVFIYLLPHSFGYSLFLGLTFFLFASLVPRGEWENIHLLMRAVINSEQARPSLPLSECLFLSAHQPDAPPSFLPLSQSVSSVFSRPSQLQRPPPLSLLQSLHFIGNAFSIFCVSETVHTELTNYENSVQILSKTKQVENGGICPCLPVWAETALLL